MRILETCVVMMIVAIAVALAGCADSYEGGGTSGLETTENSVSNTDSGEGSAVIVIETSLGTIRAELWPDKAPKTVANMLRYVDEQYYDGLIFHRVMGGFMIQGGGLGPDMREKATHDPIVNEARTDAPNNRGTLAMARTSDINSASSQFFINLADNDFLNHKNKTAQGFGYCAFGQVVDGMDVVDTTAKVKTRTVGGHENVPAEAIVIKSIRRAE